MGTLKRRLDRVSLHRHADPLDDETSDEVMARILEILTTGQVPQRSTPTEVQEAIGWLGRRRTDAAPRGGGPDSHRSARPGGRLNDWLEKQGCEGRTSGGVAKGQAPQRSKLRIEQRWRVAAALAPKLDGRRSPLNSEDRIGVATADDPDGLIAEIMELIDSGRVKLPPGFHLVVREDDEKCPEADRGDFSNPASPGRRKPVEDDYSDIA
jgi:hypothetical protein